MTQLVRRSPLAFLISLTGISTTVAVNPWTSYDPINLPKLVVLLVPLPLVISWAVLNSSKGKKAMVKIVFGTWALYATYLIVNSFYVAQNSAQAIWGTWGRNTGAFAYIALTGLLASSTLLEKSGRKIILELFTRLSYFITAYTFIQFLELDPINWGQNLTFATLGNINFMSSFLGLANLYFIGKITRDHLAFSAKIHFLFLIAFNSFLIFDSGSIQGLAMFAAGAALTVVLVLWERGDSILAVFFTFFFAIAGIVASLSVAGFGPFGTKFLQDTVLYRSDYWQAGWKMFLSSPLYGLGIDSYGDYYREFRSEIAVDRTGPARVANTAHNVFLDLMSGGGILGVGFLFGALVIGGFLSIRLIAKNKVSSEVHVLLPIIFGFFIFCLISINQLGVGVWGFIFLGLLLAAATEEENFGREDNEAVRVSLQARNKKYSSNTYSPPSFNFGKGRILISQVTISCLLAFLAVQQLRIDSGFLSAYKEANPIKMESYLKSFSPTGFYEDKLLVFLSEKGSEAEALRIAKDIVKKDDRQFTAWSLIAYSPNSTTTEKVSAAKVLFTLDPFNDLLREELKDLQIGD